MVISFRSSFQSISEYINSEIHPAILHIITLLFPVNVYVIGDWLGAGIQWPFFRYQETYLGSGIINIFRETTYIFQGVISGKSAVATSIFIAGVLLLLLALFIALVTGRDHMIKTRGYLLVIGALLFLLSSVIQYGILLHGPAGFVIPVGIPILLIIGFVITSQKTQFSDQADSDRLVEQDLE